MNDTGLAARRAALEARRAKLSEAQQAVLEGRLSGHVPPDIRRDPCVLPLNEGAGAPLFLVHPAGGDVLCFAALAREVGDRPVYGLQSPGFAGEREPFTTMEAIGAHFVGAVRQVQPTGPYHLAGWSLGAQVAFELAHQLTAAGQDVEFLGLIDGNPAAGPDARATLDEAAFADHASWLDGIVQYLERVWGRRLDVSTVALGGLDPNAQLEAFVHSLEQAKVGIPHATVPSVQQLKRVLAVYKANMRALIAYSMKVYPGPMTVILADEPADWTVAARAQWAALTTRELVVRETKGDHYSLMASPQVEGLGALLRTLLDDGPRGRT